MYHPWGGGQYYVPPQSWYPGPGPPFYHRWMGPRHPSEPDYHCRGYFYPGPNSSRFHNFHPPANNCPPKTLPCFPQTKQSAPMENNYHPLGKQSLAQASNYTFTRGKQPQRDNPLPSTGNVPSMSISEKGGKKQLAMYTDPRPPEIRYVTLPIIEIPFIKFPSTEETPMSPGGVLCDTPSGSNKSQQPQEKSQILASCHLPSALSRPPQLNESSQLQTNSQMFPDDQCLPKTGNSITSKSTTLSNDNPLQSTPDVDVLGALNKYQLGSAEKLLTESKTPQDVKITLPLSMNKSSPLSLNAQPGPKDNNSLIDPTHNHGPLSHQTPSFVPTNKSITENSQFNHYLLKDNNSMPNMRTADPIFNPLYYSQLKPQNFYSARNHFPIITHPSTIFPGFLNPTSHFPPQYLVHAPHPNVAPLKRPTSNPHNPNPFNPLLTDCSKNPTVKITYLNQFPPTLYSTNTVPCHYYCPHPLYHQCSAPHLIKKPPGIIEENLSVSPNYPVMMDQTGVPTLPPKQPAKRTSFPTSSTPSLSPFVSDDEDDGGLMSQLWASLSKQSTNVRHSSCVIVSFDNKEAWPPLPPSKDDSHATGQHQRAGCRPEKGDGGDGLSGEPGDGQPVTTAADVADEGPVTETVPIKDSVDVGASKQKKKLQSEKWSQKLSKQTYTHSWMMTSIKGHTGQVTDLEFSPNTKFLITCAEDGSSGTSSGSEGNKENNPRSQPTLSRRQKKNRTRKDDGSPGTVKKKEVGQQRQKTTEMSNLLLALNLPSDYDLYVVLHKYILNANQLVDLGFPLESSLYPGKALIYKHSDPHSKTHHRLGFDVNAREFVPKENNSFYINSLINNPDEYNQIYGKPKSVIRQPVEIRAEARRCVRCSQEFFVTNCGEYLTNEHCTYHWGKLHPNKEHPQHYTCCKGNPYSKGCTIGKLHVWSGISVGFNGPLEGFMRTKPRKNPQPDESPGIYSLDCEMCYTTNGLELARITIVAPDGKVVYDTLVRPESEVIDYNTRFSGVSAKDFINKNCKSFQNVQNDLMGFIKADTILVGHGLDNDLRALKLIHMTCVDTSVIFPHHFGLPYRRSLKSLAVFVLKQSIQTSANGHDSREDARTCMGLMLYRLQRDVQTGLSA